MRKRRYATGVLLSTQDGCLICLAICDRVSNQQQCPHMQTSSPRQKSPSLLGTHLAAVRRDRGFSLRQVEDLTKKAVSNAYLSQVESGKILQPSPNILHALSAAYQISYEQLMEMAGYIGSERKSESSSPSRKSTLSELNLSEQEEKELLEYLQFRRSLKGKATG